MEEPKHRSTEEEAEEEFIAKPSYYSPAGSSPMIKQTSLLKMKKMLVPKKGNELKTKEKQVIAQESGNSSRKKKRTRVEDLYDNDETKLSVMERVEEVLDSIADESPSFVKCMLPSNVSHGFWLFFPKKFCSEYLPTHDATIILVGECGKEYETTYFVDRHGLSAGWRGFSLDNRLLKGDLLVFELIKPCTLKVHIVRVYGLDEVDAALCLMNIVSQRTSSGKKTRTKRKEKMSVKPLVQWNTKKCHFAGSEVSNKVPKKSRVGSKPRKTCSSFEARHITSSPTLQVAK